MASRHEFTRRQLLYKDRPISKFSCRYWLSTRPSDVFYIACTHFYNVPNIWHFLDIRKYVLLMSSTFVSNCQCEQLISLMKSVKSSTFLWTLRMMRANCDYNNWSSNNRSFRHRWLIFIRKIIEYYVSLFAVLKSVELL